MIWESGKLLTAEQTARLARMNSKERDRKVQLIARRLRKQAEYTGSAKPAARNTNTLCTSATTCLWRIDRHAAAGS